MNEQYKIIYLKIKSLVNKYMTMGLFLIIGLLISFSIKRTVIDRTMNRIIVGKMDEYAEHILNPAFDEMDAYEEYRIDSIVKDIETGEYEFNYIYDVEEIKSIMENTNKDEFLTILDKWEYSDSEELNTPMDTINGKSNCQGVTLYVVEWLVNNLNPMKYGYTLSIRANYEDQNHLYINVKYPGEQTAVWDMSTNKKDTIGNIRDFLEKWE